MAIAISLVPVLAVVGITLGSWRLDLALGAFILFLTNVAAILVAGALVFSAAGYQRDVRDRDERAGRRARRWIIALLVILLIPLGSPRRRRSCATSSGSRIPWSKPPGAGWSGTAWQRGRGSTQSGNELRRSR